MKPPPAETRSRRQALVTRFEAAGIDALLVTSLPSVRYLTGFTGSSGVCLITGGEATLFTDPRYTTQARAEVSCRVKITKGKAMMTAVVERAKAEKSRKLGFASGLMTHSVHAFLRKELPLRTELVPADGLVEALRMVKSPSEAALIRQAVETNSRAFERALTRLKPGMTEGGLAAEIDYEMRQQGAEGVCFETIVASGERAALPHARPSRAQVQPDRLLLVDMGACQEGYASDMTRTVGIGKPPRRLRAAYEAVLEAQLAAIDAVRPGVTVEQVDRAARKVLRQHGLEKAFVHSLGHGLGLEIHEGPRLGRGEKVKLEPGMAITIEPGVYLPGDYGIRIEDTVLVTASGVEVLTPTPKAFQTYL